MRLILPSDAAFNPDGTGGGGGIGTLVYSTKIDNTATADVTVGPTTVYTVPSDGLYVLYAMVETYNPVAMATGTVVAQLTFTGGSAYPWDSSNLSLTAPAQMDQTKSVVARRCVAGSTIDLLYVVATFSGTSSQYSIYLAIFQVA
jgi:hypothetical protein